MTTTVTVGEPIRHIKINNAALARGENIWREFTDDEIIEALSGKTIWVRSTMSENVEKIRMSKHDARHTKITAYTRGKGDKARKIRCIEFAEPYVVVRTRDGNGVYSSGFRVIRLRNIVKVK